MFEVPLLLKGRDNMLSCNGLSTFNDNIKLVILEVYLMIFDCQGINFKNYFCIGIWNLAVSKVSYVNVIALDLLFEFFSK